MNKNQFFKGEIEPKIQRNCNLHYPINLEAEQSKGFLFALIIFTNRRPTKKFWVQHNI